MPDPLVAADLPERPDAKPIPPGADWAVAADGYVVAGETDPTDRAGICMSMEKASRAARYVVGYNELRGLYEVDIRTWSREREIYSRSLEAADREIERWQKRAERSWWERNRGVVGLAGGLVLGVAAAATAAAALDGVTK